MAARLKELSPKYNSGRRINVVNQRLGYLVRCGDPDALDSVVPMVFGNLALDLILEGTFGRLVSIRNGVYDAVPLDVVNGPKKEVDVARYYNVERLRPNYETFQGEAALHHDGRQLRATRRGRPTGFPGARARPTTAERHAPHAGGHWPRLPLMLIPRRIPAFCRASLSSRTARPCPPSAPNEPAALVGTFQTPYGREMRRRRGRSRIPR